MFISKGNKKVQAGIFNLPCKKTCKKGLACQKYCYAQKAERLYPQVKPCRENNLKESKRKDFIPKMIELITKQKSKYFRIHEAGDFYSKWYIIQWYTIIRALPDVKFYAYTKRDDLFSKLLLILKPKNLTLILSLDGIKEDIASVDDIPNGYDKLAITHKTTSNCAAILNPDVKCMRDCFRCVNQNKEVIVFKKHKALRKAMLE
jgi:hypothetical protein